MAHLTGKNRPICDTRDPECASRERSHGLAAANLQASTCIRIAIHSCHMTRSATLPPIRVAPETKASLEAVLRDGESLTQFIESAVRREAEFRAEQNASIARAKKALRSADKGVGLLTVEDFLVGMEQRALAAQQRIREAVETKKRRAAR